MAFMMPVVKNDWDIYSTGRSRPSSESSERGGRVRKVSESRSEGAGCGPSRATLSPHRSAPAMRSLSYSRPPPSRASLRTEVPAKAKNSNNNNNSSHQSRPAAEKLHNRARGDSPPQRSRCGACMPYL